MDDDAASNDAFTRYFRAVRDGVEVADAAFVAMWSKLCQALSSELGRTSMRTSPPAFAGVVGYATWDWHVAEETSGPLDALASGAYEFIFDRRWGHLVQKLETGCENIDGFVVLYLRDFLRRRRKRNDPVGYRVYTSVRRALRQNVEAGRLTVLSGQESITNDTLLGTRVGARAEKQASAETLGLFTAKWTAELLPGLVTARRGARRPVIAKLREQLCELGAEGVETFRVRDLMGRFRREVRVAWAGLLEEDTAPWAIDEATRLGKIVALFLPGKERDEAEEFEALIVCVSDLVDRLDLTRPTREHLETLWGYLQSQSRGELDSPDFVDDREAPAQPMPSRRGLAKVLDIPRNKIGSLFATLAEQVEKCRSLIRGTIASIDHRPKRRDAGERRHA